ncbi:hypothetical protein EV217_2199 [Phyllobacterium myrsinacearum]|uniref:hypothetical protein n=1 Tax=Phyllobacterium myrsinacearum TaxID=28101 RepID=UPI00102A4842|nr:hypothetical protein [Phyllobacterium myrsinacearum]RZS83455.1 hypothetical protein EV217_2199 [Phyllobacterium myrsinacearum]
MAATSLVRSDVDAGLKLITILDQGGFGVVAALWLFLTDAEKWKLVVAYKGSNKDLEKKYFEAATLISNWRKDNPAGTVLDLSNVRITGSDDPLITGLKRVMRVDGTSEVRFSNNLIDGIYVEDALIHRLAA